MRNPEKIFAGMGSGGKKEWEIVGKTETKTAEVIDMEKRMAEEREDRLEGIAEEIDSNQKRLSEEEYGRLTKSNKIFTKRHEIPKYKNKIGPTIRREAA